MERLSSRLSAAERDRKSVEEELRYSLSLRHVMCHMPTCWVTCKDSDPPIAERVLLLVNGEQRRRKELEQRVMSLEVASPVPSCSLATRCSVLTCRVILPFGADVAYRATRRACVPVAPCPACRARLSRWGACRPT
eukprot:1827572-Rhodomonas_salina.1